MASAEADLLKVAPDASLADIKKAYRQAALTHHPDHNPDPHAGRHFRSLTAAYRVLAEKAQRREAPKAPKLPSPSVRLEFLLADLRSMVKRWPEARWSVRTEGLPATVWVAGILEVLDRAWPGVPLGGSVTPSVTGLAEVLVLWSQRVTSPVGTAAGSKAELRTLTALLDTAEARVRALDRPLRRPSK